MIIFLIIIFFPNFFQNFYELYLYYIIYYLSCPIMFMYSKNHKLINLVMAPEVSDVHSF